MIGRIVLLSSAVTCGGVFAGTTKPAQASMSNPVTPASSMVGRSGSSVLRLMRVVASARSLPARTCSMPVVRSTNIIDTRPAIRSTTPCGVLL